ncbi:ROK family protein [Arsenophonus apicola]|uniref:ROK family protein n=1 Tax=Arsenophonus apicola TaxID=2879119 RepID=A0ABY8NYW4_9GAMM|nr:ROK family protein [Arsenophonus apicola]WGO82425.1 ROK family protein [Arsenophonus apicola]
MNQQVGHTDQIKQINLKLVYRLIDQFGSISRISLAKKARLAPASITKITRELINAHLIREVEFPDLGFRGRPITGLEIVSQGWQFLCIRINKGSLILSLYELNNKLLHEDITELIANDNESFNEQLLTKIEYFFSCHQGCLERLVAISVITNAIINSIDGIIISSPYYSIKNFPLRERLETRIGLPIYLQNCTTAWTMSEFFSDTSKYKKNIIQIVVDDHVSACIVTKGSILPLGNSHAIEIGHININFEGVDCFCGNQGCLETLIAIPQILKKVQSIAHQYPDSILNKEKISIHDLCQAINLQDPIAVDILEKVGREIGNTLAVMVNIFNPQLILIGSPLNEVKNQLFPIINKHILQKSLPCYQNKMSLVATKFNNEGTLLATAIIKDALYNGSLLAKLMEG